jgi:hypothetical protein
MSNATDQQLAHPTHSQDFHDLVPNACDGNLYEGYDRIDCLTLVLLCCDVHVDACRFNCMFLWCVLIFLVLPFAILLVLGNNTEDDDEKVSYYISCGVIAGVGVCVRPQLSFDRRA